MEPVFSRRLDIAAEASYRSVFLFGPRQTGKTHLLRTLFPNSPAYNLLLADTFLSLSQRPMLIREAVEARSIPSQEPIIIDEIQKLPALLDEVHNLIEAHGCRFILTGSSSRKLKRSGANMLGGRARTRNLFPLVTTEIPDFDLLRALNFGTLPSVYTSPEPREDLLSYCGTYLQEEIQAEGAVRRIESFSRFLQTAALVNGELVNFEQVASDAAIPARTIREYFTVLEDTLIGTMVKPFGRTRKRKAVSVSKFYLFDVGVSNILAGRTNITPKTDAFGRNFEHWVFTELRAWLGYTRDIRELTFWRDTQGAEVDFVVGDDLAIEVKGTELVTDKHLKGLSLLAQEIPLKHRIVVSLDPIPRRVGEVEILPWAEFVSRLWAGAYAP